MWLIDYCPIARLFFDGGDSKKFAPFCIFLPIYHPKLDFYDTILTARSSWQFFLYGTWYTSDGSK